MHLSVSNNHPFGMLSNFLKKHFIEIFNYQIFILFNSIFNYKQHTAFGILETSILQPIHPARFAVFGRGGRSFIIVFVK